MESLETIDRKRLPPQVQTNLGEIAAFWPSRGERERRLEMKRRRKLLKHNSDWLIRRRNAEPEEHFRDRPRPLTSYVPMALRQLSYLYRVPPVRVTETPDEWSRLLWDRKGSLTFDQQMLTLDKLVRTFGTVLVRTVWEPFADVGTVAARMFKQGAVEAEGDPETAGFRLEVATPDECCVIGARWDPSLPSLVAIKASTYLARPVTEGLEGRALFVVLDDTYQTVLDVPLQSGGEPSWSSAEVLRNDEHNRGRVPIAVLRDGPAVPQTDYLEFDGDAVDEAQSFWSLPWQGADLLHQCRTLLEHGSCLVETSENQRGQLIHIQGEDSDGKIEGAVGMYTPLTVANGDALSYVSNAANLAGIQATQDRLEASTAVSWDLPGRTFRMEDVAQDSGRAILADRIALRHDRIARQPLALSWERALMVEAAATAALEAEGIAPLSTDLRHIWPEDEPPQVDKEPEEDVKSVEEQAEEDVEAEEAVEIDEDAIEVDEVPQEGSDSATGGDEMDT